MPYLDNIVSALNKNWIATTFSFLQPHQIKAYGIAETMIDIVASENEGEEKQVRYPSMIDEYGEVQMIIPDDNYALIMYHRLEGITNSVAPKTGFGDSAGDQFETANMSLIVFAFRTKVRKAAHWMEAAIKATMPETSAQKDEKGRFIQSSTFRIGNSSFDKLALLGREYSEVGLPYPNVILFELKYRIENTWRKGCFLQSDC